jgi:hypothetical protein
VGKSLSHFEIIRQTKFIVKTICIDNFAPTLTQNKNAFFILSQFCDEIAIRVFLNQIVYILKKIENTNYLHTVII